MSAYINVFDCVFGFWNSSQDSYLVYWTERQQVPMQISPNYDL